MKNKLLIWICQLFPIRHNKIMFISHLGKGYGCNPKYICEYLRNYHSGEFKLHWVYDPTCSSKDDIPQGVLPVNMYSLRFIYDILTCGFLISNTRLPLWFNFKNRKGQCYIQTWHSSLRLKMIEGDANLGEDYEKVAQSDASKTSIMVSGCKFSSDIYKRAFWYSGPILEVGTPRIDFLLNQNESDKFAILDKAGLDSEIHYVLYAPTFRKGGVLDAYNIDYKSLVNALVERFGGKWKILCRLHPNLIGKVSFNNVDKECIDVTNYNDIQELLIISDILITDFSSCMFDVAFMRKPCLLYASDYLQYIKNERNIYFDIQTLPFSLTTSNDELVTAVNTFDMNLYANKVENFLSAIGTYETGKACEKIYGYLKERLR